MSARSAEEMNSYISTFFDCDFGPVDRCSGNKIFLKDGRVFQDLTGGVTSHSIVGWGDKEIAEIVSAQILQYPHLDYKTFYDPNREALGELLINSAPDYYKRSNPKVFFPGTSGSDGVEAAVKLAYQYHLARGDTERVNILSYNQSYHGSTLGSMSLGDRPNLSFYSPLFPKNVYRLGEVNNFRCEEQSGSAEYLAEKKMLEFTLLIERLDPRTICCIVGETIAGGLTGFVPKPDGYWQRISDICQDNGILLILDEVICGTGTTGTYYAWSSDGVSPDITVLGKTLCGGYFPLNALLVRGEILKLLQSSDGRVQQSNTFQGHSLAARVAHHVQSKVSRKEFLLQVRSLGQRAEQLLNDRLQNSIYFKGIAGRGLRFSVQLRGADSDIFARYVTMMCERQHGILIDGKWHRFTFSPQLDIEETSLMLALERFIEVFLRVEREGAHLCDFRPSNDIQRRY